MNIIKSALHTSRLRQSKVDRTIMLSEFHSDKSRIVFCSSFRRMMQKAQVFSLELNSSVRNRLTHSLEVADIGRTIAFEVGQILIARDLADLEDVFCMQSIVENACLIHDIGNPPFGHFGESAIKAWYNRMATPIYRSQFGTIPGVVIPMPEATYGIENFDGNPQGLRIVTKLHTDKDKHSLNLTYSTLLAALKYPNSGALDQKKPFHKKVGIFHWEKGLYDKICRDIGHETGKRYFLSYLMELADDICYCLSDISDAFEKGIIDSRMYKEEIRAICKASGIDASLISPSEPIISFSHDVAIPLARKTISEAALHFVDNINLFMSGDGKELSEDIPTGKNFGVIKEFARRFIYTNKEVQSIEISGSAIVNSILDHFSVLLQMTRKDFELYVAGKRPKGHDLEYRIFNQLSDRMVKAYSFNPHTTDSDEWSARCQLIIDYVSGLTDPSALRLHRIISGVAPC